MTRFMPQPAHAAAAAVPRLPVSGPPDPSLARTTGSLPPPSLADLAMRAGWASLVAGRLQLLQGIVDAQQQQQQQGSVRLLLPGAVRAVAGVASALAQASPGGPSSGGDLDLDSGLLLNRTADLLAAVHGCAPGSSSCGAAASVAAQRLLEDLSPLAAGGQGPGGSTLVTHVAAGTAVAALCASLPLATCGSTGLCQAMGQQCHANSSQVVAAWSTLPQRHAAATLLSSGCQQLLSLPLCSAAASARSCSMAPACSWGPAAAAARMGSGSSSSNRSSSSGPGPFLCTTNWMAALGMLDSSMARRLAGAAANCSSQGSQQQCAATDLGPFLPPAAGSSRQLPAWSWVLVALALALALVLAAVLWVRCNACGGSSEGSGAYRQPLRRRRRGRGKAGAAKKAAGKAMLWLGGDGSFLYSCQEAVEAAQGSFTGGILAAGQGGGRSSSGGSAPSLASSDSYVNGGSATLRSLSLRPSSAGSVSGVSDTSGLARTSGAASSEGRLEEARAAADDGFSFEPGLQSLRAVRSPAAAPASPWSVSTANPVFGSLWLLSTGESVEQRRQGQQHVLSPARHMLPVPHQHQQSHTGAAAAATAAAVTAATAAAAWPAAPCPPPAPSAPPALGDLLDWLMDSPGPAQPLPPLPHAPAGMMLSYGQAPQPAVAGDELAGLWLDDDDDGGLTGQHEHQQYQQQYQQQSSQPAEQGAGSSGSGQQEWWQGWQGATHHNEQLRRQQQQQQQQLGYHPLRPQQAAQAAQQQLPGAPAAFLWPQQ
jgi:hypothetical protein